MFTLAKPWILSLQVHALFWGVYGLLSSQALPYTLRGFWQVLTLPLLALVGWLLSLEALKCLQTASLPRWQRLLLQLLHGPGLAFMVMMDVGFLMLMLGGMISPNHYTTSVSPSQRRSVTIVSHNISCTQMVYLNRGLVMESVGSFQIGSAKCLNSARATIQWQPGDMAISWQYRDRQGIIPLPAD